MSGSERPGPDADFGKLPCALLGLLLPPGRRDEFIGDLLEEARQRAARSGQRQASHWLWGQVFQSCPSLVVARLRRIPASRAVALAVPAGVRAGSGGAFGGFLVGRPRPRRSFAVSVSVLVHVVVLTAALIHGMWSVDELAGPRVVIRFWTGLPPVTPLFEEPAGGRPPKPLHSEPRSEKPVLRPHAPTAPLPAALPVTLRPGGGDGENLGAGSGKGAGLVPCPEDADCGGAPLPPRSLPPKVGEKSCLSCPLPQLPPAFLRIGTQSILTRICVDADGHVVSAKILSGLGGAADDGVIETLQQWRFQPYAVDGRPVPFCYVSRFVFTPS